MKKGQTANHGLSEPERFWMKVQKTASCWLWIATKNKMGYGFFHSPLRCRHPNRKGIARTVYAHRWAYEELRGPIPEDLTLDHLCRNTSCVNPDHLEPVLIRENILRGDGPTARLARQTHCKRGHAFTEENTYLKGGKQRCCKICRHDESRERWSREKEQRNAVIAV